MTTHRGGSQPRHAPSRSTNMALVTQRPPGAQGRLSLALNWGPPTLVDCIGTRGAAHSWVAPHGACTTPRACPGCSHDGGATVHVSGSGGGGQRAHHPNDRTLFAEGGGGAVDRRALVQL